jgi:3-oxoacyl-[acyl-carrier protein] reductase
VLRGWEHAFDGGRIACERVPESIPSHLDVSEAIVADKVKATLLNRAVTLEDVGNVAAFVASDKARSVTAATANISSGALID